MHFTAVSNENKHNILNKMFYVALLPPAVWTRNSSVNKMCVLCSTFLVRYIPGLVATNYLCMHAMHTYLLVKLNERKFLLFCCTTKRGNETYPILSCIQKETTRYKPTTQ